jgi:hypothetical protein
MISQTAVSCSITREVKPVAFLIGRWGLTIGHWGDR